MNFNYFFFLLSATLLSSPVLSIEVISCASSNELDIELDGSRKIVVYSPEVSISFDRQSLSVYEYPHTDAVNILINDTYVVFTGRKLEETQDYDTHVETSWIHLANIVGSARLIKKRYDHVTLSECDVYMEKDSEVESNPPIKMQIEILRQAAVCLKASLCSKLGKITPDDTRNAKRHPFTFGSLLIPSKSVTDQREKTYTPEGVYNIESIENSDDLPSFMTILNRIDLNDVAENDEVGLEEDINKLVDSGLAKIINEVKQQHKETMKLLDVTKTFTFGKFDASNGFFSDLSTIRRTSDAKLIKKGLKYYMSGSFGLKKTEINYKSYKIIGLFNAAGSFVAKVTGVSAAAAVAVDYNQKPCKAELQSIHVNNIGHIDVSFTGLGPLSHLASTIAQLVINTWQKSLIAEVERTVSVIVQKNMKEFDCEKYRPKTIFRIS